MCPHSRFVRLAMGEFGLHADLIEERTRTPIVAATAEAFRAAGASVTEDVFPDHVHEISVAEIERGIALLASV